MVVPNEISGGDCGDRQHGPGLSGREAVGERPDTVAGGLARRASGDGDDVYGRRGAPLWARRRQHEHEPAAVAVAASGGDSSRLHGCGYMAVQRHQRCRRGTSARRPTGIYRAFAAPKSNEPPERAPILPCLVDTVRRCPLRCRFTGGGQVWPSCGVQQRDGPRCLTLSISAARRGCCQMPDVLLCRAPDGQVASRVRVCSPPDAGGRVHERGFSSEAGRMHEERASEGRQLAR